VYLPESIKSKLNVAHGVCWHVNLLVQNINSMNKNMEPKLDASNFVGLPVAS
jgi:hypothetical protein